MNENLDLVKILKGCPVGTKLYSTVYGECEIIFISRRYMYPICVKNSSGDHIFYTRNGLLFFNQGECTLFPSKEQRDWSKFKIEKSEPNPETL